MKNTFNQDIDSEQSLQAYYQLVKAFNRNRHRQHSTERTVEGDDIAYQMRELAPAMFMKFDVGHWLISKNTGKRFAAIQYLNWSQDIEYLEELVERLHVENPFIQFHILLTLKSMLDQLDSGQEKYLQEVLKNYDVSEDGTRGYWKNQILTTISPD